MSSSIIVEQLGTVWTLIVAGLDHIDDIIAEVPQLCRYEGVHCCQQQQLEEL